MFRRTALGLVSTMLLSACGEPGGETNEGDENERNVTVDDLIEGIAEKQILRDVESFAADTEDLRDSVETLCEEPAEASLEEARQRWTSAASRWYRVQLFNFGPADADPIFPLFTFIDSLRLRGTDYTSTVSATLERWRTSEDELDAGFWSEQRFDDVGLLAVELSLFEAEDVLAQLDENPRNCEILTGLTGNLADRAEALRTGWAEDYEGTGTPFVELLIEDQLPNGRAPLVQLVISGQEYLDYLHARGVVALAGRTSGTGFRLVEQGLVAVERLLTVDQGGKSVFFWMGRLGHSDAVELVNGNLESAKAAIEDEDPAALEAALTLLDGNFKREVPNSLGIELGLTFTDGD